VKLAEALRPEHLVVPLPGGSVQECALMLLERARTDENVVDMDKVRERLEVLSSEDLVAIPDRAFIVHLRTDAVRNVLILAGLASEPVSRVLGENETQSARLVFLLLAPPRRAAEYLQLLSALNRFLSRHEVIEAFVSHAENHSLESFLADVEFELPRQLRVRDIMSVRPRTTTPDTALRDAAREMVRAGLGGLIAVDADSHIVGMLGERELMRDLLINYLQGDTAQRDAPASTGRRKVRDVMTRQVLGVSPDQPLSEVASIMVNKDVERVPVVEDGKLAGVLTRADIVRKLIGY
jgi:CBS domain-containing protein/mannitol/fructose-specific phosphotransferase system IIA component (Ntr-type)